MSADTVYWKNWDITAIYIKGGQNLKWTLYCTSSKPLFGNPGEKYLGFGKKKLNFSFKTALFFLIISTLCLDKNNI